MQILINLGYTLRAILLTVTSRLEWLPLLLFRIAAGAVFANAGWGKLHNLDKVVGFFRQLGIPNPELQAPFVAVNEFVCGILVIAGLFTRVAAIPPAIIMVVALVTAKSAQIHGPLDLFGTDDFLLFLIFVSLVILGPGPVSLDRIIVDKRK